MTRFDELISTEALTRSERDRLERVHQLLVRVGPPPELPRSLRRPPAPWRAHRLAPGAARRPRGPVLLLAAALVVVALAVGLVGRDVFSGNPRAAGTLSVRLRATAAAPLGASALITAGAPDTAGNWAMKVVVAGLRPLPVRGYYVVYLVRHGRRVAPCGFFNVGRDGHTSVRFSVPYQRTPTDAWAIAVHRYEDSGRTLLRT